MDAVIDSSYVPLNVGMILYSFWLSLNCFARSLTHSPFTAVIECHHWISVCAWAGSAVSAAAAMAVKARDFKFMFAPVRWAVRERADSAARLSQVCDRPVSRTDRARRASGIT